MSIIQLIAVIIYSVLKLFTGLDDAALNACVLMVIQAMNTVMIAAIINTHQ